MNSGGPVSTCQSEGPGLSQHHGRLGSPWRWPRRALVALLRSYKRFLSPLLPPSCRFTPTCAEYAMEAVGKYGVCKGIWLAGWRVLRCNPLCRGGYDPVP
ncbi:MAG: membrane protein insertion efficiency factor YidD [Desulfobulbus sp.]|jgi:putative membrane protein insertion efficiency factor